MDENRRRQDLTRRLEAIQAAALHDILDELVTYFKEVADERDREHFTKWPILDG